MSDLPSRLERLALAALLLLGLLLPFELKEPLLRLGPPAVTNVELALYLALAAWAASQARQGWPRWTAAHTPVLAWACALGLSAALAPVERGLAVKFALRSLGGCALFYAAAGLLRSTGRAAALAAALALGACLSALAGLAEVWLPGVRPALAAFKTQTTLVGSFVRASGTLQYANIAAMYWEAVLLVLVGLAGWQAARGARGPWRWFAGAGALTLAGALVLSGSRAGLAAAAGGLAVLAAVGIRSAPALRRPALAALAGLGLFALAGLAANPWQALRLRSESTADWYRAGYTVAPAALTLETGQVTTVSVTVRNEGVVPWPAAGDEAIHLSYHWLDGEDGRMVIFDGWRSLLPQDVSPGEQVTVDAFVLAPSQPGRYALQWDMVQEEVLWFSAQGDDTAEVPVEVRPAQAGATGPRPAPPVQPLVQRQPARLALWRAAGRMWLEHPLLGVGPDNFRHIYGRYLDLEQFDRRIHANSLYLETLATLGLAGALALAGLVGALGWTAWRGWHAPPLRADPAARALAAGLLAALAAFLLHGLFDYFLEFTPTYTLFWLLAGAAAGLLGGAQPEA
jgi:hypothetical protein